MSATCIRKFYNENSSHITAKHKLIATDTLLTWWVTLNSDLTLVYLISPNDLCFSSLLIVLMGLLQQQILYLGSLCRQMYMWTMQEVLEPRVGRSSSGGRWIFLSREADRGIIFCLLYIPHVKWIFFQYMNAFQIIRHSNFLL